MRFALLVICLGLSSKAFAFSAGGHRIIAEIAWQQPDESTRSQAVELLKHHPRLEQDFISKMPDSVRNGTQQLKDHWLFLEASVWPDTTRGLRGDERQKYHRGPWHYVNFPTYLNRADEPAIDLSRVNRSTAFEGVFRDDSNLNIIQAIKANLAGLQGESRSKAQRAVHLCWVMHLVGDAHQPLHATALFTPKLFPKGDRGGNLILTDKGRNLHSLWDRLLPLEKSVGRIGSVAAKYLKEVGQFGKAAAKIREPEEWLRESLGYAGDLAYGRNVRAAVLAAEEDVDSEVTVQISEEYLKAAGHLARRRAVEAGYRLANVLNGN